VSYKLNDTAASPATPAVSTWTSIPAGTTTVVNWAFNGDIGPKEIQYQLQDSYNNVGSVQTITTSAPVPTASFMVQDISNTTANPPVYNLYLGWKAVTLTDVPHFDHYVLMVVRHLEHLALLPAQQQILHSLIQTFM
jgi:hypothetical protein